MPAKIAEINKQLNDSEKEKQAVVLESKPQRIVIEATNRCNLRCRMCGQSHRHFAGVDMSFENFNKTGPFWATAYDISLFGWGEPLLNPHLGTFFDLLSKHQARIFILTNAMLLTDNLIDRFIGGGLSFLNFSVDGATPETYNKIRRGADFETVIANIGKVVAAKKRAGSSVPYLRMVFVGMKQNIEEFPGFVELAAELGMNEAKMVHMIAYGREMQDQILFHHKELTNRILDEAEARAQAVSIKLTIPDRFNLDNSGQKGPLKLKHKFCPRPWEELFVQSDGKIRLCMLSKEIMGDLSKESVEEIWNNEKFQYVRRMVNSKTPPSTCAHCPQYKEMNVNDINAFLQVDTELPGTAKKR